MAEDWYLAMHKENIHQDRSCIDVRALQERLDEAETLLNDIIDSHEDSMSEELKQKILATDKLSLWQENQALIQSNQAKDIQIQQTEWTLEKTLNSLTVGLMILDMEGKIKFANNLAIELLEYPKEQLLGHPLKKFLLQKDGFIRDSNSLQALIEQAEKDNEIKSPKYAEFLTHNGEKLPVEYTTRLVDKLHSIEAVISFQDIRERIQAEKQLIHEASYDHLIQIPNRYLFEQIVEHAIVQAERDNAQLALLYIDINNLHAVNQAYGFIAGSCLLKDIVSRIKLHLRKSDLIARVSGDEFAIYIGNIHQENDASTVAEKIKKLFDAPFNIKNDPIYVQTNMGIACYPQHGKNTEILLTGAEAAMYTAKAKYNSSIEFYQERTLYSNVEYVKLESDIHLAIKNKQFFLNFLPQYDLETGAIVNVESLVRWDHPKKGIIPPNKFLPIIESQHLSKELFMWIFSTSINNSLDFQKTTEKIYNISINLSESDFFMDELPSLIESHITSKGIEPHRIYLEFPEIVLMKDIAHSQRILRQLKALGMNLVVDDFGLAHSSLFYLNRLPVDELKIDMSFIQKLNRDPIDKLTIQAIIQLAHTMGLKVTAEGVEDQSTADFLKENNCDYVQGYHFSKPVDFDSLAAVFGQI